MALNHRPFSPDKQSVNDGMPKISAPSHIANTIDSAIYPMHPETTLLAKISVRSSFWLLPVHPSNRHLLAMDWDRSLCIDTCLPLDSDLDDLLSWILTQKGVFHYLDDFLILGPPESFTCASNLATIKEVCSTLGIPLALEKVEGLSTAPHF